MLFSYCAFDSNRAIGELMLMLMLMPMTDHGRLIIDRFHVSRDYRRRGLRRRLPEAATVEALRRNARTLYASACSAEETIRFYLAMGFAPSPDPIASYAEDKPCDLQPGDLSRGIARLFLRRSD